MPVKDIRPVIVKLTGYEIKCDLNQDTIKDGNTIVTVDVKLNGHIFTKSTRMWAFEVSKYLQKFGGEI
jgi:hypothetical protein